MNEITYFGLRLGLNLNSFGLMKRSMSSDLLCIAIVMSIDGFFLNVFIPGNNVYETNRASNEGNNWR